MRLRGRLATTAAAAACLVGAACSGADEEAGRDDRIDPAPPGGATPRSQAPSPAPPTSSPAGAETTGAAADGSESGPVRVRFAGVETIDADDAEALETGGIPAALRLRGETGVAAQTVVSTTLTCRPARQRLFEVPVRRNGLPELRGTARVVAGLTGEQEVVVLGPRTDLAVLLARDDQGRVRARTLVEQVEDRWFAGSVEDCR